MPKIIGGSLAEHREQTRQRIFAAFGELMSSRGYDSVSLADVSAAAGVGRTAMYNHYPDKESLLLAFIDHETQVYVEALERTLRDIADPVAKLAAYLRQQLAPRDVYHLPGGFRSLLSPSTVDRLREHARMVEAVLREILADGIEHERFAVRNVDATVPLITACLVGRDLGDLTGGERAAAIDEAVGFVLRAVGARAEPSDHG